MIARLFTKAQIIASTHSPFVVASADQDAHIIRFNVKDGRSTLDPTPRGAQVGTSVDAVLADVFGIESRFDIETESMMARFHELQRGLAAGQIVDRTDYDTLAQAIAARGEELASIVGFEVRQLDRQLARAAAG
jgi:predicted ATP-binding protein involved in virulence